MANAAKTVADNRDAGGTEWITTASSSTIVTVFEAADPSESPTGPDNWIRNVSFGSTRRSPATSTVIHATV